jgi:restriction system protein
MKLTLPPNSLFGILLRSPWWISFLAALGVFLLVRIWFHPALAAFATLPLVGIGLYAAFQQFRRPGAKRVAATLERARALPWDGFCSALEEGFRREGYGVQRQGDNLQLTRSGRVTLVACKRWKAVRTGVEPLREFDAASGERGAHERVYVAAGEVTDTARAFAAQKQIRLLQDEDLAKLLTRTIPNE